MTTNELPSHWVKVCLGDIVHKLVDGSHTPPPKQNTGLPMLSAINISNNKIDFSSTYRLIDEESFERENQRTGIAKGDVLLTIVGAIGRSAVVPAHAVRFTLQRSVAVIGLILSDPKFLMYQLEAPRLARYLTANARGTAQKGIYLNSLGQAPVLVAPIREQHRIVAKIEELFSELDKGIEALTTAREQLKAYRFALLKHAFEGKLTEDWRNRTIPGEQFSGALLDGLNVGRNDYHAEQLRLWQAALWKWRANGQKGKRPPKPERPATIQPVSEEERERLPSFPKAWACVRLATIAQIGSGMSVSKDRELQDPIEVPYLRVANVQRGKLDLTHVTKMKVEKSQIPQLTLNKWDILFNEGGDRDKLGRGWVWESQIVPCITQNHVFRASPYIATEFHAKFVSYWGNTFGQRYFNTEGKQTTNLASINKAVLSAFPVPLPSMQEQAEIVRQIEALCSKADQMQSDIETELTRANALRQSILNRAFSGQLITQNPKDEPASVLLERIRTERKVFEAAKKQRNRKIGTNRRKKATSA